MSEPRNVTPEGEVPETEVPPPPRAGAESPTPQSEWYASWDTRKRGFPLLGVLLVLVGVGLLVQYVIPQVSVGTLVLLAIGAAFLAAWLIGRAWFSMVPGFLVLALGVAELIEDLGLIKPVHEDVPGLAASALAIGFLVIFVVSRISGRRWTWPLWAAAIFGIIGVAQLSAFVALPQFGAVIPVLIIVLGVIVLFNWRRERA